MFIVLSSSTVLVTKLKNSPVQPPQMLLRAACWWWWWRWWCRYDQAVLCPGHRGNYFNLMAPSRGVRSALVLYLDNMLLKLTSRQIVQIEQMQCATVQGFHWHLYCLYLASHNSPGPQLPALFNIQSLRHFKSSRVC